MNPVLFCLSESNEFLSQLRGALDSQYTIVPCKCVDSFREQAARERGQAVLIHVNRATIDSHLPHGYFTHVKQAAGDTSLISFVEPGLPDYWTDSARQHTRHVEFLPTTSSKIRELFPTDSILAEELASQCAQLPNRALHGRTRSLITFTPEMFDMIDELKVPAAHDVTVLLIGETGCGKTHLARLIHELSDRRDDRCLTVACGALPPDLIESELFGYVRGAFTGADRDKEGKFAAAGHGTLLLDEIDVLPLEQQAKLLRVIETGEFEPVGSNETLHSQARLIVASNFDLEGLVHAGSFRKDLFYRLNMLSFRLLPLRSRPWDIEYLARKFALDHGRAHGIQIRSIDPEFLAILRGYPWPGNIRELENVTRRAVLYSQNGRLSATDLPSSLRSAVGDDPVIRSETPKRPGTLEERVDEIEQRIIEESLRRHNHHRTATAKELGISRVTLYNKMKKFGMLK